MEDAFLTFSRSLPAATLLMLLALFVTGTKTSAVRRHQWLGWGLGIACLIPFIEPHLPQWRILPRVEALTLPNSLNGPVPWFLMLAGIWFLGTACMLIQTFAGIGFLHWHQRTAIPADDERVLATIESCRAGTGLRRAPEVFLQPSYAMPMTWGWLQPRIWLPLSAEDWSEEELECVLLHEMAHIERRDFPAEILNRICLAIYWFHPVAWMLSRRIELAREMACDDQVLLAGTPASNYAESLAHIGAGLQVPLPTTAAGFLGRKPLIARMIGIADPWRTRSRLTGEDVWATVAPLTMAALFVCSLGFKAAAEIHSDHRPDLATPESNVVSVWDDWVVPTADALGFSPAPTPHPVTRGRSVQPRNRPRHQKVQSVFHPAPAKPSPISKPIQLARLELPRTTPNISIPLVTRSSSLPSKQPVLVFRGRTTSQPALPETTPTPTESKAPATEASASNPTTVDASSSVASNNSDVQESKSTNPKTPTEKSSKTSPKATQPRQRRELGAAIVNDSKSRSLKIDCLIAKGSSTKLLRAEMTTDFKNWTALVDAISTEPADAENDRLILQVAANVGSGFIRIREIIPTTPKPDKPSTVKGSPLSINSTDRKSPVFSLPSRPIKGSR